jgi:formamidopyrimidine-DNA glycosylase
MPETPELQTFKTNLSKRFKGKKIAEARIFWDKKLKVPAEQITESLKGLKLDHVTRSGKMVLLDFKDVTLGIHLMQSGRPYLLPFTGIDRWRIIEIEFTGGEGFGIHDFGRQARVHLNPPPTGVPDVLGKDFNAEYLLQVCRKFKNKAIKTLLTDQKVILGIGNAYVDEILWDAKIAPQSNCYRIPEEKIADLIKSTGKVLAHGEREIMNVTGASELMIEKRDFMKVHNVKKKLDPDGLEILKGQVDKAKTYYTASQVLYK